MDKKIKNYLGIAIIIVIFVFALVAIKFVSSYSRSIEPSSFRSFSVSGEGKVVAIPDVAQFTFSVITEGDTDIAKLQKENTEKVNKAIKFLKSNDIETKDIKTQSYNLQPRYQYSCPPVFGERRTCSPPEIVGYTITQTVSVKVRDFDKIGKVLAGAIENGANSVSQLSFTIDEPDTLQNQARVEAIEKAKEKAKAIAKAGDFSLGRLLSIEEGSYPSPIFRAEAKGIGGAGDMSVPTIEPGSQEITVNVILTFEIE